MIVKSSRTFFEALLESSHPEAVTVALVAHDDKINYNV